MSIFKRQLKIKLIAQEEEYFLSISILKKNEGKLSVTINRVETKD